MKLRSLVAITVIVLSAASCSKDFDATNTSGRKLSRILVAGAVKTEFLYDGSGRLVKYTSYITPTIRGAEAKRYYDSKGRLTRIEQEFNVSSSLNREQMDPGYSEMTYDNNDRLIETRTYRTGGGVVVYASRSVPDYDAEGRTIAVTIYDPVTNQAYHKNTYQYNSKNNIISGDYFQYSSGIQGPTTHYVYEHDDKKNPYKNIWVMPYGANQNNITKQVVTTYTSVQGATTTNTGITLYKRYDQYGYPTLQNDNGVDYEYEYR